MREQSNLLLVWCDVPKSTSRWESERTAYAHVYARGAQLGAGKDSFALRNINWNGFAKKSPRDVRLADFMLSGQFDNKTKQPYGVRFGYQSDSHDEIVTLKDVESYERDLKLLNKRLESLADEAGPCNDTGTLCLRLARAMGADYIVVLPTRPWNDPHGDVFDLSQTETWRNGQRAVVEINWQIEQAHIAARKLCGEENES